MHPIPSEPLTSVLLIDGNDTDRKHFAGELKFWSSKYQILEAADGRSGLDLYRRSQRIDCVVLEITLSDISGLQVLVDLVPIARKPTVAVIVLTQLMHHGLRELALQNGAAAYFTKKFTVGEHLHKAIQRAVTSVGVLHKENRQRSLEGPIPAEGFLE